MSERHLPVVNTSNNLAASAANSVAHATNTGLNLGRRLIGRDEQNFNKQMQENDVGWKIGDVTYQNRTSSGYHYGGKSKKLRKSLRKSRKTRGGKKYGYLKEEEYDKIVKHINADVSQELLVQDPKTHEPKFLNKEIDLQTWEDYPNKNKTIQAVGRNKARNPVFLIQQYGTDEYYLVDKHNRTYNMYYNNNKPPILEVRNMGWKLGGKSKKLRKSSKTRRKSKKMLKKGGFLGFENRGIF